ncbi:MAG: heme-binding protein, partial [Verrucomicrobiota bacterium]
NTNDGGGWNVRFHHFSGLEDHGYPRMYKNFNDEIIQPLADYGGGSGCGSVYLAEPGFPDEWNNAPLTCDWGTGGLWHHAVERRGAGFVETTEPKKLISMTRPTDADVDGMSGIYQASWIGPATFKWAGAEQGYVVRVSPSGYTPDPLLDFAKASDDELIELLKTTESQVRRIAAQRALLKREENPDTAKKLEEIVRNADQQLPGRIAALYALSQRAINDEFSSDRVKLINSFNTIDAAIQPFVNRALGDLGQQLITQGKAGAVAGGVLNHGIVRGIEDDNLRTTLEAIVAAARQNRVECADTISPFLADEDPVIAHTAFQALAKLNAHQTCFTLLNSKDHQVNAARALMRMHDDAVVDEAIGRLEKEKRADVRQQLLAILSRLYHREAEWTGASWGTRPDTRGPYYQPETWDASERILTTLKSTLAAAEADEAAFLVREMNRNRIQTNDALDRIIELASADAKLVPDAVAQIATQGTPPAAGIPLLFKAATMKDASATTLSQALVGLSKIDDPKVVSASITALDALLAIEGSNKEHAAGMNAFLKSPKLENHHLAIEKMAAEDFGTPQNRWANIALIELASRTKGSPESREMSAKAINKAWENPAHRLALINTIDRNFKSRYLDARILLALSDSDAEVAKAAEKAARTLRLQLPGDDKTPKVGTLKPEEAVKQIVAAKGNAALGEAVFTRATCNACHTVSEGVPQKGPYLGNIAQTYKRLELTEAIIIPSKTIAQGFKTNLITLNDGSVHIGFVTDEAGDTVTMRDIAAQEATFKKSDIASRETNDASMMPPMLANNFTVNEIASLVTYLEELAKKK